MIERLGNTPSDPIIRILHDKINEIIDHLPQESGVLQADEVTLEFFRKYLKMPKATLEELCQECYRLKQPTKEVPDIRPILERLIKRGMKPSEQAGYKELIQKDADQAIQEISALYRKEK